MWFYRTTDPTKFNFGGVIISSYVGATSGQLVMRVKAIRKDGTLDPHPFFLFPDDPTSRWHTSWGTIVCPD